ncbi:MAG: response regulator [Herminiimonas sp.]|nr:response regulator [Herminiimonas sp.]
MDVLIIDDDQVNLKLFARMLAALPNVTSITASNPIKALKWATVNEPDLVLVDYMMPGMDGLQFLERFRALPGKSSTPVIMATADAQTDVRYRALQLSANDFLTKPVHKTELRARVSNLLALRQTQVELARRADWLAEEVEKATAKILAREREAIHRLARVAEYRDPETGAHLIRLERYTRLIGAMLGLPQEELDLLGQASPMHDIGKVGIPDRILLKPGRLDDEEMAIMRTHSQIGADILEGSTSPLLQVAAILAITHHEKFDGSGYPHGLKGDAIHLYGRIVAVADVFDALTSERPYKAAWSPERAAALLRDSCGSHFDPQCVAAFFAQWDEVLAVFREHRDT